MIHRIPVWTLFLVAAVLCAATWYPGHDWGGDFAAYVGQARALVEGDLDAYLEDATFLRDNSGHSVGPAVYGWGFPVLLAPLYAAVGWNVVFYKALMSVFLLGAALALWKLFASSLRPIPMRAGLAIFLFSPTLVEFTNVIYSDLAFLCLYLWCFVALDRWREAEMPVREGLFLGALVFLCSWVRPLGVLVLAPMAVLAIRRRRGAGRAVLPAVAVIVLLMLASMLLPGDRSDLASVIGRGVSPWENLRTYLDLGGSLYHRGTGRLLFWIGLPLALLGAVRDARRHWPLLLVSALMSGVLLLWPANQGPRLLFPLLAVYCFWLARGFQELNDLDARLRFAGVLYFAVALVHVGIVHEHRISKTPSRIEPGPDTPWASELWEFVETTDPEAVFTFRKPRVLHMYTGRRAVWSDHWDESVSGYLIELLEYGPATGPNEGSELVFENEGFRVHQSRR